MKNKKNWQNEFQKYLAQDYARARKGNSHYSMRSYGARLGISSGVISDILSGKRKVSEKRAAQIIEKTLLPEKTKRRLLNLILPPVIQDRVSLPGAEAVLTDWVYLAIIHFFDTDIPDKSVNAIADRLSLPIPKVKEYLRVLEHHKLLRKNSRNELEGTDVQLSSSDGIPSSLVQKYHLQGFELASEALLSRSVDERDFTSLILAGNKQNLDKARELIRDLYREIGSILACGNRDEVYRVTIGVFPLLSKE
jgi:hypothetical protein